MRNLIAVPMLLASSFLLTGCEKRCACKTASGSVERWEAIDCNEEWDRRLCVAPHALLDSIQRDNKKLAQLSFATNISYRAGLSTSLRNQKIGNFKTIKFPDGLTCINECQDNQSPWCLAIPNIDGQTLHSSISKLATRLSGHAGVIQKPDIMSDFNVTSDPCDRSDTFIKNGSLSNSGKNCLFSADVKVNGAQILSAQIQLPSNLKASFAMKGASDFSLDFKSQGTPQPNIILGKYWNEDFGGKLQAIDFVKKSTILTTERGCIWVK